MPVFEQADIMRWFNQGENNISNECLFLQDRFSPTIVSGTNIYLIPDYVRSISRVTYRGKKLTPLPKRDMKDAFQSATQLGQPFWYIYNNTGQNKIQLFPNPNENLAAGTDLWASSIPTCCIVEFYRISDNEDFILPDYARNPLLKRYAGELMFLSEGPGQNLKMASYFEKQWEIWKAEFIQLVSELHSNPRKLFVSDVVSGNWFPGSPMLPIDKFGISVDTGF